MLNFRNTLTVAKFESKTLFRSWFFRIFSLIALIFIVVFNLFTQTKLGFPMNDFVSLPSKVPFVNLYILNMAQAIIAVFLASDFLKRDKKLDTTEVIYIRAMTNAEYVFGKTLGNLYVFFSLNLVALGVVAVFNSISPYSSFNFLPYIYYFLLISIPTLVFIMGLAFLLMGLLKNQAITFILLIGYILTTVIYLPNKFYHLFDYMAYSLPLTWSEFIGFGNLNELLIQRGIYFFLGLGFIGLTVLILKRLSQSKVVNSVVAVLSTIFIVVGLGLGVVQVKSINNFYSSREQMVKAGDQYQTLPVVHLDSCSIDLEHLGDEIFAETSVFVSNSTEVPIEEFVMNLNPGLVIESFNGGTYKRDNQLLVINTDNPIQPGKKKILQISYRGKIDEAVCYLDYSKERLEAINKKESTTIDKRYAFVEPDFLMLTPETRWYPVPGVNYSSKGIGWIKQNFTKYSLRVKSKFEVFSQGKKESSNGITVFTPEMPLPSISVVAGNYETRSVTVDSVEYNLSYLPGHDYFDEYFNVLQDSIEPVIRTLKENFELKVRLEYPYNRLSLIEVPCQFTSYEHLWSAAREQVQPEMVFLPEGGYNLAGANFAMEQKMKERRGKRGDAPTETPLQVEERMLRDFANRALFNRQEGRMARMRLRFGIKNIDTDKSNPCFIFPNLYNFSTAISSEKYPITNRVFESYLIDNFSSSGSGFMRNIMGTSEDEEGNMQLREKSFAEIIKNTEDYSILDNVIRTKSKFLIALMKGAAESPEEFDNFLFDYLAKNRFKTIKIEDLQEELVSSFSLDLGEYMDDWYHKKSLPGYILGEIEAKKVRDGDRRRFMVTFNITNIEEESGVVSVSFRMGGRGRRGAPGVSGEEIQKIIPVGGKETVQANFLLDQNPRMMSINTLTSKNIPVILNHRFDKVEVDKKAKPLEGIFPMPFDDGSSKNEIILDNESPGVEVIQTASKSRLKEWLNAGADDDRKYKGMNFWKPPVDFTLTTNSEFYGREVRSAYYTKSGEGDRFVRWNVPVQEAGYYKVYTYIPNIRQRSRRRGGNEIKGKYTYTVVHDDGEDKPEIDLADKQYGWVELGSYYFSPDTAKIELSNKSDAKLIYADAVKLVKEK